MGNLGERRETVRYDVLLVAVILFLTLLGLAILYSASYLRALNYPNKFKHGWSPLVSNLLACGITLFVVVPALALTKFERLKDGRVIFILVLLTAGINFLPFVPYFRNVQYESGSAMRWIYLKKAGKNFVSFQPSEIFKVMLPLYLAYILDKNKERLDKFSYGPLPPILITALFCSIVLIQSNFSEAVLIAFISMVICFVAGIHLRWFALIIAFIAPAAFLLIQFVPRLRQRWDDTRSAIDDIYGADNQIKQSLEAIQSGGFWGKGIGQGTLKVKVPEIHGDFVFASFVEETGFLGVVIYIILIGAFVWIGYLVAWRSKDRFAQFLAFGLVTPIVLQTLLNIAVVARVVPVTGVPLPFVSSGGTSMLMTLISAALLVKIARQYVNSEKRERPYVG